MSRKKGFRHSEETKRKMSAFRTGKRIGGVTHHSEETKRKISMAVIGHLGGMLGKRHSEDTKKKMSVSRTGHLTSNETKRKISITLKGHSVSKSTRKKLSNHKHTEEAKRKMSKAKKGVARSKEICKILSVAQQKKWQNPKYNEKQLKAIFKGNAWGRINKPEKKIRRILNRLFPKEYKYVGNGTVFIGGKSPDFININGQKKIIELFGDYWHSKKVTGLKKKEHRKQRQRDFAKYGYDTLIIWEKELQNIQAVKLKIKSFHKKGKYNV